MYENMYANMYTYIQKQIALNPLDNLSNNPLFSSTPPILVKLFDPYRFVKLEKGNPPTLKGGQTME